MRRIQFLALRVSWPVAALVLAGCYQMQESGGGEGALEGLELELPEADHNAAEDDTDTPSSFEDDLGGAYDPETGLVWQNPALDDLLMWQEAMDYCEELVHGGYDDWRLPDVDELQTLLRGCPGAEECGVDDPECLTSNCNDGPHCGGCEDWEGPTADGCYTVDHLEGWCELYWSRSPAVPGVYRFWLVDYIQAKTLSDEIGYANGVRCIRVP